MTRYDAIIIGAGAAGLMCAIEAGKRGKNICVIDKAQKPAEKVRISGGGRCNFTNIHASHKNYISNNPHFCKSALKQYTQHDFIKLVEKYKIPYHEKTLGQLFCDNSSKDIINMLLSECKKYKVEIKPSTTINKLYYQNSLYKLNTNQEDLESETLVIACGGLSIPKMGATDFGYTIAKRFGHKIIETDAALVPFTFEGKMLEQVQSIAGLSLDIIVKCNKTQFEEAMLFTHRGISGPSILQISSYWHKGYEIEINLAPKHDIYQVLLDAKEQHPSKHPIKFIQEILPRKLALTFCKHYPVRLNEITNKELKILAEDINSWKLIPADTEGYRTAEVTRGGVDTNDLSSSTMESKLQPNLYFIGEVVDVTGWLGGYNFQWAWSSGYVAGKNL